MKIENLENSVFLEGFRLSGAAARTEFLKNKERINYCNIDSKGFCENTKTKSGVSEKYITDSGICS